VKLNIELDQTVKGKLQVGFLYFQGMNCRKYDPQIWQKIRELGEEYRQRFKTTSEANELLQPARKLYRSIGIEPTKTRPSSEALFRRIVKGKELYQINTLVDVGNYCSLRYLLPIGLYDVSRIHLPIQIRLGEDGEGYQGIGKEWVNVSQRITLADSQGPFGNPTSDSLRTAVTLKTTDLLVVIFAPHEYPGKLLFEHLNFTENEYLIFHQGQLTEKGLIN